MRVQRWNRGEPEKKQNVPMPIADGRRHEGRLWKRGVSIAAYLRTTDYRRSTPDLDPGQASGRECPEKCHRDVENLTDG
jgi:hypothetical protein